jgi:hypothetical protein
MAQQLQRANGVVSSAVGRPEVVVISRGYHNFHYGFFKRKSIKQVYDKKETREAVVVYKKKVKHQKDQYCSLSSQKV